MLGHYFTLDHDFEGWNVSFKTQENIPDTNTGIKGFILRCPFVGFCVIL